MRSKVCCDEELVRKLGVILSHRYSPFLLRDERKVSGT